MKIYGGCKYLYLFNFVFKYDENVLVFLEYVLVIFIMVGLVLDSI